MYVCIYIYGLYRAYRPLILLGFQDVSVRTFFTFQLDARLSLVVEMYPSFLLLGSLVDVNHTMI